MANQISRYEIFLKTAELGSITLAAEALNYTQSGVSQSVAAMERDAGCTLFRRSKTGVELTENGKALLTPVRELVEKQHALDQAMDALSNRVAGTLRIGSFTSFTAIWMAGIIRGFTTLYPDVKIELTNGPYSKIEEGIADGRLDCGFLTAIENDPFDFEPLFDDPMLVVCSPGHPLSELGSLPLGELRKYPVISQFKGSDHDVQQIIRKCGIRPKTKYIFDDDISVMGMVAQNEGIAIMPRQMIRTSGFGLAVIPLDPPQYRTIGLAALKVKEPAILIRAFRDFCKSYDFSGDNLTSGLSSAQSSGV